MLAFPFISVAICQLVQARSPGSMRPECYFRNICNVNDFLSTAADEGNISINLQFMCCLEFFFTRMPSSDCLSLQKDAHNSTVSQ